jgi:hypothetical protein
VDFLPYSGFVIGEILGVDLDGRLMVAAQMSDWEERDKSWKKFRQELEGGKRGKLAKRLGMGRP